MDATHSAAPAEIPFQERAAPDKVHAGWRIGLSLAVAVMGFVDLLSGVLSHPPERLVALLQLVPTEVIDTSRTFTLLAGALLLVTAWGLRRGKRRAFVAALFLCAVSVPVNLLKAFDFEEATVAAALLFLLGISADAFRVKSRELSLSGLRSRALALALALAVYSVAGCWLLEATFGNQPSLARALGEAGFRLFGLGEPTLELSRALAPPAQRIVRWFLGSLPLMGFTSLVGLALAALRPVAHRQRHRDQAGRAAALLRRYGDGSLSAFALAAETDYFFSPNGRAVVPYHFESDTLLVLGDPVGPDEELAPLLEAFAAYCREHDWLFAFFQARPERLPLYRRLGWRWLHIGEDPVLWTDRFTLEGSAMGEVRRAVRKFEAGGMEVRMYLPGESPFDPARDPEGLLEQMRQISGEWLRAHGGRERGFGMGRFEPHALPQTWLALAIGPGPRRVEAFVTWVPIWARRGWALDLMRRRADAPNGVMELLIANSVATARSRGDALLSLSLSPLARVDPPENEGLGETSAAAQAFLMEHLARFYDFEGLFRWKKKFNPAFEDRYLVFPTALALPGVTLALVRAQGRGGLSYLRHGR